MGFNLGLGLRAANAYFQEGDAQKVRDQQEKRWGYENKKEEAGLSTLADRTEADRARFRANAAQDSSSLSLQPLKTQEQQAALDAKIKDQQFAESQRLSLETHARNQNQSALDIQPTQLQTAETAAQTALSNAKVSQADAGVAVSGIPQREIAGKEKQFVDGHMQHEKAVSILADAHANKDKPAMIKALNGIREASGQGGAPIADVGEMPDPNNPSDTILVAIDANGSKIDGGMPVKSLKAMAARNAKPAEIIKYGADQNVAAYSGGVLTPLAKADPSASANQSPIKRNVDYLVKSQGMTERQALEFTKTNGMMSRQQFILMSIKDKNSKGYDTTDDDEKAFGAQYDRIAAESQQKPAAPGAQRPTPSQASPSSPARGAPTYLFGRNG